MMLKRMLAAFSVLFVCISGCSAQKPPTQHMLTRFERTGTAIDGWDWAAAPWTGDDKPYQRLREDIYNQLVAAKDVQSLLDRYKAEAKAKPKDPLAQFAWGYAALRAASLKGHENVVVDVSDLPDELAAAPFPRTYDYARLRFLAQAQVRPNAQLEDLGRRLLKHTPLDIPVEYQQIRVLRQVPSRSRNTEALRLANSLAEAYPSQLAYIQTIGNLHEDAFTYFGFKKADAEAAIAAYQKYLRLAPANDPIRGDMERIIGILRKGEV